MVVFKIIGFILLLLGYFILRYFPDVYQRDDTSILGIMIGIFMALVGVGLLIFG